MRVIDADTLLERIAGIKDPDMLTIGKVAGIIGTQPTVIREEVYQQGRAETIDDCKAILKSHHMLRTAEDDYVPSVEVPFYTGLWKAFEKLKEQK